MSMPTPTLSQLLPAVFVAAYNLDYTGLFITPDGIQLVGYGSEQQLVPTAVFYPFYAVANGRQSVTAQTKIIISDIRPVNLNSGVLG